MTLATEAGPALTSALKPLLTWLVDDMRARLEADGAELARWHGIHDEARAENRTAVSWTDWSEDQLTQAAVGWLLTSVFVRFCEDNLLLGDAGAGSAASGPNELGVWITNDNELLRQRALDAENDFYRSNPDASYREWLQVAFDALAKNRATAGLVDQHAAIHIFAPSSDAVEQILTFWRTTDDWDSLVWRFNDPDLSTRFLGDLYQDLSDFAKRKYALLQTPEFVEEFILDQTLEPALKDRSLEGFKLIDPTCGSGHFLLGAFQRFLARWRAAAPAMEPRALADLALQSVYGVDLNPFAVAIAQFRLLVAAMQASGDRTLVDLPGFTINVINGDSLLHGPDWSGTAQITGMADAAAARHHYRTEDPEALVKILTRYQYDVVVGNPPYITVKDKALNAAYRQNYNYCKGTYALTVPFMELFFELAKAGDNPGWVGQITSNSFMKREFGVPLIEQFLAKKDLRLVIDSSGAYIPGHGTPTVILVGRNQGVVRDTVRAVLGIQGEPGAPDDPAVGKVWTSIADHSDDTRYEDQWISVTDLPRANLAEHPWSLSGGGAVELGDAIDRAAESRLEDHVDSIGFGAVTREDAAYMLGAPTLRRAEIAPAHSRPLVAGEDVRDWALATQTLSIWPYSEKSLSADGTSAVLREMWPYRTTLSNRIAYGENQIERGLTWFEYSMFFTKRYAVPLSITFAEVATHNHFVLDRGGKVFKQTAPVIKLPADATEDDHLRLLGILNSSSACFWLKQNCHDKGIRGEGGGFTPSDWERFYQFNGTTVKDHPLPAGDTLARSHHIDDLATKLSTQTPAAIFATSAPTPAAAGAAEFVSADLQARLIAQQDELDWEVYCLYGLTESNFALPPGAAPGIALGERAFEIALARRVAAGETGEAWFARHGSTPITEIPDHWPADYRDLVQLRLNEIESNPFVRLLEKPEYKRRWAGESWEVKLERALRNWLLDRLEDKSLWFTLQGTPQPLSVAELAARVETSPEFITALDMWAGQKDAPVTKTLEKLLAPEAVPFLDEYVYKPSGLRKRAEWNKVWELQRQEDAGEVDAKGIPVPPKYTSADFKKQTYWSHRGKLDVPKERFISYPGVGRATDPTPLLGWAGWNHAYQGLALALIYAQRESEGAPATDLAPITASLTELLPWIRQWHLAHDSVLGVSLYEYLNSRINH
ncbi:BREX-2 system adenine-specific DNA-methyltransferase PglX [Tsukamurella soli]|uniref:site-specific DNA-methyltransferase (adenine-specific) n=1 Tax=Tsukamurella soli TaxID=644556 RepID=A0ABP8K2R9_9ACTN